MQYQTKIKHNKVVMGSNLQYSDTKRIYTKQYEKELQLPLPTCSSYLGSWLLEVLQPVVH